MVKENPEEVISVELSETSMLSPGTPKAYILFSSGQRMDLTTTGHDTMIMEKGMQVRVGSSGKISYVPDDSGSILKQEIVYNTIVVPRGGEYKLELADGTLVWLNSDSELRYPVKFAGSQRDVWLKGEGYFEVEKNAEQPFIVKARTLNVEVLGTRFNLFAYPEIGQIATTLEEGAVQVRLQDEEGKTFHLVPDEQLVYYIESGSVDVRKVVSADYSDWREGGLLFDNYSFTDIIRILQRTYGLDIHLQTSAYNKNLLTVHFNKNESVENIFMLLKELIPGLEYKIDGKSIYLK